MGATVSIAEITTGRARVLQQHQRLGLGLGLGLRQHPFGAERVPFSWLPLANPDHVVAISRRPAVRTEASGRLFNSTRLPLPPFALSWPSSLSGEPAEH